MNTVLMEDETLQIYRNPGGELRGVIYVTRGGNPAIVVKSFPAVTVEFDEPDSLYVAVCDCFDIVGTGRDEASAIQELEITARVFLSELLENNCLYDTLLEKGWVEADPADVSEDNMVRRLRNAVRNDPSCHVPRIVLSSANEGTAVG